jgi:hypothetical protein
MIGALREIYRGESTLDILNGRFVLEACLQDLAQQAENPVGIVEGEVGYQPPKSFYHYQRTTATRDWYLKVPGR